MTWIVLEENMFSAFVSTVLSRNFLVGTASQRSNAVQSVTCVQHTTGEQQQSQLGRVRRSCNARSGKDEYRKRYTRSLRTILAGPKTRADAHRRPAWEMVQT